MTVNDAIVSVARKTDPLQARCLRCCATTRLLVVALAGLDVAGGQAAEINDEAKDAEVSRLFGIHPELRSRFRGDGRPVDCRSCV